MAQMEYMGVSENGFAPLQGGGLEKWWFIMSGSNMVKLSFGWETLSISFAPQSIGYINMDTHSSEPLLPNHWIAKAALFLDKPIITHICRQLFGFFCGVFVGTFRSGGIHPFGAGFFSCCGEEGKTCVRNIFDEHPLSHLLLANELLYITMTLSTAPSIWIIWNHSWYQDPIGPALLPVPKLPKPYRIARSFAVPSAKYRRDFGEALSTLLGERARHVPAKRASFCCASSTGRSLTFGHRWNQCPAWRKWAARSGNLISFRAG